MSAGGSQSDPAVSGKASGLHLDRVAAAMSPMRVRGGLAIDFATGSRGTHPTRTSERDGYRVRFPNAAGHCEGVMINTGGGLAGGDHVDVAVNVSAGANATLTTLAAERVYRSLGPPAVVDVTLKVGPAASLAWLPQETLLYSGSNLRRRLSASVSSDGVLLIVEMIVFGRLAMGETVEVGVLNDQWRVRRGDELVFAEAVRLDGPIRELMDRPAIADGARAAATLLYVAPDAEDRLDGARAVLAQPRAKAAAGAWNGLLTARFLGHRVEDVRGDVVRLASWLHRRALPRLWST